MTALRSALLAIAFSVLSAPALAAGIDGRAVADKLVGNTARIYDWGCGDDLPNAVYYFRQDGTVSVQTRGCNLPEDRASSDRGRWELRSNRFCLRAVGDFDDFCFGLNAVSDNTYRFVFFNPIMRQAWTIVSIDSGNSFGLD